MEVPCHAARNLPVRYRTDRSAPLLMILLLLYEFEFILTDFARKK